MDRDDRKRRPVLEPTKGRLTPSTLAAGISSTRGVRRGTPMMRPFLYPFGLMGMMLLGGLLVPIQARADHVWIVRELPNEGGVQTSIDGQIFNSDPGSETQLVGANFNEGNYVPQVINVNLYEDAAHTVVSDRLDITVPAQNPPQINVGLTSDTDGVPLQPLTPENLALTETGAVQFVVTLTNSNGIRTNIFVQSDAPEVAVAAPEPSGVVLLAIGCLGLLGFAWRLRRPAEPKSLLRSVPFLCCYRNPVTLNAHPS